MKFLVTGGAGYIGSVVTQLLLAEGHDVTVLDDLSTGHRIAVPAGVSFVDGRVHDVVGSVLSASYDGVLHFAAFIAAGESVVKPAKYWDNNLVGSLRLLDAMRSAGVRRIVFSSTANVYGDPDELPIPETAVTRPPNPYAASKLAVDHALRDEAIAHGLAAVSLLPNTPRPLASNSHSCESKSAEPHPCRQGTVVAQKCCGSVMRIRYMSWKSPP